MRGKSGGGDLSRGQSQLHVPVDFAADVEINRVDEFRALRAIGEKGAVLRDVAGENADADLVLDGEAGGPDDQIDAQFRRPRAEPRAIVALQRQPRSDELLDFDLDVEDGPKEGAKPRRRFGLAGQNAGQRQLARIGQPVEVAEGRRSQADMRADMPPKRSSLGRSYCAIGRALARRGRTAAGSGC